MNISKDLLLKKIDEGLKVYMGIYEGERHYDLVYFSDATFYAFHYVTAIDNDDPIVDGVNIKESKDTFFDVNCSVGDMEEFQEVYLEQV